MDTDSTNFIYQNLSEGNVSKGHDRCVVICMAVINVVFFPIGLLIWIPHIIGYLTSKTYNQCCHRKSKSFSLYYICFAIMCALAPFYWYTIIYLTMGRSRV